MTTPGECPALCPGDAIVVRDTIIEATPGADSTYLGYTPRNARQVLLVSDGLVAGEYRSFVVFAKNTRDSVQVDGTSRVFTIDTVALSFTIEVRDTLVKKLRLHLYRIPITTDTTITFTGLTDLFTPAALIDSIQVADSVKSGRVEVAITGDQLTALLPPAADSGRLGVGIALTAEQPTGVRLALDPLLTGSGPLFEYRGLAAGVVDTSKRRQRIQVRLESISRTGYVTNADRTANLDPDLLYLGGPGAARSLLRFEVPSFIRDSTQIIRATLLLTPAETLAGLPNNRFGDFVSALGLVVDLGRKSPTVSFGVNRGTLPAGSAAEVAVDVYSLVAQWQTDGGAPQGIFLQHSDETIGGGFMQPVFYSTRSPIGRPKLRITYGIPAKSGQP
ncbi:MAG: hypothetical protein ACKVZ0_00885 [Gemmatimonadales bacterium]